MCIGLRRGPGSPSAARARDALPSTRVRTGQAPHDATPQSQGAGAATSSTGRGNALPAHAQPLDPAVAVRDHRPT